MSVGFAASKSDIDNTGGGLCRDLDSIFTRVQQFAAWLATQTDAALIALGYVQAEVNTLRSAITDLNALAGYYQGSTAGSALHAGASYDYRVFARLLAGINVH